MKKSSSLEILGIASRDGSKARMASESLGIPRAYGSYEELLADPEIDAIYNPLPNHLHLPWTVKAAEAGKHVLCEKPIAMDTAEAKALIEARDRTGVVIGEAFMVRTHPQWLRTRELIQSGTVGELKLITSKFSYFNKAAENIRNIKQFGGGGLMDIGCYPVTMSRFLFGREPKRVLGLFEFDPESGIDRLSSGVLDFDGGQAIFACGTQLVPSQSFEALCPPAASRSRFRLIHHRTNLLVSRSTMAANLAGVMPGRNRSLPAISINCKARLFLRPLGAKRRYLFRSKMHSQTWPRLEPCSSQVRQVAGKSQ